MNHKVKCKVALFAEVYGNNLEEIQTDIARYIHIHSQNVTAFNNTDFKFLSFALIPEPGKATRIFDDIDCPGDGYFQGFPEKKSSKKKRH